jgi:hypothetical protein
VLEFLARLRFSQRPAGVAPGARTLSSCLRTSASWATDRSLTEICVVAIGGQVNSRGQPPAISCARFSTPGI